MVSGLSHGFSEWFPNLLGNHSEKSEGGDCLAVGERLLVRSKPTPPHKNAPRGLLTRALTLHEPSASRFPGKPGNRSDPATAQRIPTPPMQSLPAVSQAQTPPAPASSALRVRFRSRRGVWPPPGSWPPESPASYFRSGGSRSAHWSAGKRLSR